MILGDLGADVIKVERPGQGDESRGWGPPFDADGESAYYLSCNRNKLSVALDLDASGRPRCSATLMREADVVLENFRDGRACEPRHSIAATWLDRNPEADLVHHLRIRAGQRAARL